MHVSVIIPAWNLWETTRQCLFSLAACSSAQDQFDIIVVDNGSEDATVLELPRVGTELFASRFTVLRMPENLGFARACNAGARHACGDALFFLNNDTTLTPNWLAPLVSAIQTKGVGAVGPLLLYPDGTNQHCGVSFSPLRRLRHLYAHFPAEHPVLRRNRQLQAITAAAILMRRDTFWQAGGFCEDYINGYEDLDLCCRLHQAQLSTQLVPDACIVHHESKTPGRHACNESNASLFSSRWQHVIKPDLHLFAAADGYETYLTAELGCVLRLPARQEQSCNQHWQERPAEEQTIDEMQALLSREPLWLGGHLWLIQKLAGEHNIDEAFAAVQRAERFFPVQEVYRAYLRLAQLAGQHKLVTSLTEILRHKSRPREQVQYVRYLLASARKQHDRQLCQIFQQWLDREA